MHTNIDSQLARSGLSAAEPFFDRDVCAFTDQLRSLDGQISQDALPRKRDDFWFRLTRAVRSSENACRRFDEEHGDDPRLLEDVQKRFRRETAQWYDRSWIAHRARTKPRGFAGDYRMLVTLYEQKALARGLGGYLDFYISELPLAKAVRARLQAIREFLRVETAARRDDTSILNIACGPCREYIGWRDRVSEGDIHVTCLDSDQGALDFVDKYVVGAAPGISRFRTVRYNALRTRSAKKTIAQLGRFDIIYSVGLCDYVPDKQMIGMLQGWREMLMEGGILYVAFKDGDRYDKTPYQWHLDWHFLQRSEEDCRKLFEMAGFDIGSLEMKRDETGIIMSFVFRHVSPSIVRIDPPARYSIPEPRDVTVSPPVDVESDAGRDHLSGTS